MLLQVNKCPFYFSSTLICFVIIMSFCSQSVKAGLFQKKLLDKLFSKYDRSERPVEDDKDVLNVSVGLSLQQIVDLDEKQQMLVFSGWLDMSWTDYNLKWNPIDYGNISVISVMSSKIWLPDLVLFNSAGDSFDPKSDVNAVVDYTGAVSYLPPGMFRSACKIEIESFPFDEQFCSLKFGCWTNDASTVDLKNKSDSAQMDSYVENGEWNMESVVSYSDNVKYECCPDIYPFVMVVMHLRRRTLYFIFNLVFPCVLISFMCILGFTLPPDSGEKIGLEMTTLLSIIMFSQLIMGIVPESSMSVPKIGIYFAAVMVICTFSIIANVLVLVLHHKNIKIQQPMPRWVHYWICDKLAKFLLMVNPKLKAEEDEKEKESIGERMSMERMTKAESSEIQKVNSKSLMANVLEINDDFGVLNKNGRTFYVDKNAHRRILAKRLNEHQNSIIMQNYDPITQQFKNNKKEANSDSEEKFEYSNSNPFVKSLANVLKEVRKLTKKIEDDDADEDKILEWQFAAMVIDRLCVVFFTVSTVVSTVLILFTSKNFFKLR